VLQLDTLFHDDVAGGINTQTYGLQRGSSSINQPINQSKQIYIAPCVTSEADARDGSD